MRRTRICATLGPASSDAKTLEAMVEAGLDVARLNFSHGDHDSHRELIATLRSAARSRDRDVAVMGDLAGPKIRIGDLADGSAELVRGASFTLTTEEILGDAERATVHHDELPAAVEAGQTLMLADGALELEVESTTDTEIRCRVVAGGHLTSRKGVAVPGASLDLETLTDKDEEDLAFCLDHDVDLIALSFVETAEDVRRLQERVEDPKPVLAKIERAVALDRLEAIVDAADGVLVARGDLGVELPLEKVPMAQKAIIREANRQAKPVMTATQMLSSMVETKRPTRAEVTDVSTAILDGSDAVMLSEETAVGKHPTEAIRVMDRVARETEPALDRTLFEARAHQAEVGTPAAVSHAAVQMAEEVDAAAIVTPTASGLTARLVARFRPPVPIVAPTRNEPTLRALSLVWGVQAAHRDDEGGLDGAVETSEELVTGRGIAGPGDRIVITAGYPFHGIPTNLVHVHEVRG